MDYKITKVKITKSGKIIKTGQIILRGMIAFSLPESI